MYEQEIKPQTDMVCPAEIAEICVTGIYVEVDPLQVFSKFSSVCLREQN